MDDSYNNKQSLKEIRELLANVEKVRQSRKETRELLYNTVNKAYKNINWRDEGISTKESDIVFENTTLPVKRKMRDYKWLRYKNFGKKKDVKHGYYPIKNVENLFLIQELMCHMDDEYWDFSRQKRYKWRTELVSYYFDSAYIGNTYICQIPITKVEKSKLVTEWLKKREFLFDETNGLTRPLKYVRRFIKRNLMNGKIEKWDYYLKRFLYKETK